MPLSWSKDVNRNGLYKLSILNKTWWCNFLFRNFMQAPPKCSIKPGSVSIMYTWLIYLFSKLEQSVEGKQFTNVWTVRKYSCTHFSVFSILPMFNLLFLLTIDCATSSNDRPPFTLSFTLHRYRYCAVLSTQVFIREYK